MRMFRALIAIAVLSIVAGFVWDILVWRLHFPYLPFHWLAPWLHADGEAAYTLMMCETMISFFVVFLVLWILFRVATLEVRR
jgi:hypothetical protein